MALDGDLGVGGSPAETLDSCVVGIDGDRLGARQGERDRVRAGG